MALTKEYIRQQKEKLLKEREKVVKQIEHLQNDDPFKDPDHASDNAAIDTDVREQIGHETIEAEVKDLKKRLLLIDLALTKGEKGEYGLCERCGIEIPTARLQFIPEARYCITCEQKLVK